MTISKKNINFVCKMLKKAAAKHTIHTNEHNFYI